MSESTCARCSAPFHPVRPYGRPQRYCTKACYVEASRERARLRSRAKPRNPFAPCVVCGTECRQFNGTPLCSLKCRQVRWPGCYGNGPQFRPCAECGQPYIYPRRRYCSEHCRIKAVNRDNQHRRRTAKRTGDRITIRALGERDLWRCHICGDAVTVRQGRSRSAASIDHVIPVTRGGEHVWSNVRLAHIGCNARKGNRIAA